MSVQVSSLAVMVILACVSDMSAMIEPRMDKPRWWETPAKPSSSRSETGGAPPVTPSPQAADDDSGTSFVVAPPLGTDIPPYLASPHIVGPKPPPGYHFSAGPKPARFPQHSVAKSIPERVSNSVYEEDVESSLQRRWKKARTRQGVDGTAEKTRILPSDQSVCGELCPAFRLVERNAKYDVRHYPRMLWASYVTVTENRLLAEMEAKAGLSQFLSGKNDQGIKLQRAMPTVTQLRYARAPGRQKLDHEDFSISIPLLDAKIHPRPESNQVVVDYVSKQRIFAMSFWAREWRLTQKSLRVRAKRFIRKLRRHGHAFLDTYFYLAKYGGAESGSRSYFEIWLYSTPYKSRRKFRAKGRPHLLRPSNVTLETMRRLCRGLECPLFEVLSEHEGGIQKRHYYNAVFATTKMDACDSSVDAMWRGLMPLHLYRQGINTHLEVIEATRPIGTLRVQEGETPDDCNMTSLMYLPRRLHQNPPSNAQGAPSTSLVYVHDLHVYVATVGGFVLEPGRIEQEIHAFRKQLNRIGLCFRPAEYFVAIYDFIQRYHGRLNEIWIVARHCKS